MFIADDTQVDRQHAVKLVEIARMYYEGNLSQAEIASRVGYSRPTISRLLSEARDRGVVQVRIVRPPERVVALEQALTERYGLSHTRIADPLDAMSVQPQVARCAADLIASECRPDSVVAVSNGRSVSSTIAALPDLHLPRTRVVQMIGSTPYSDMMHDSSETCRQIALKLGGSLVTLPTPLIVSNAAAARSLMSTPQVRSVLAESARADIALVGVGAVHDGRSGSIFSGVESAGLAAQLISRGAAAHICGHHIDATGAHVETSLCHRTIAVTPETLRAIPLVVAVAWGADKVPATRALLAGGYLHALVTDRDTAIALASD